MFARRLGLGLGVLVVLLGQDGRLELGLALGRRTPPPHPHGAVGLAELACHTPHQAQTQAWAQA